MDPAAVGELELLKSTAGFASSQQWIRIQDASYSAWYAQHLRLSALGSLSHSLCVLQIGLPQKSAAAALCKPNCIVAGGIPARQSWRGSGRPQRGDVAWGPPPAVALTSSSRARSRCAPPRAAGSTRQAEPTWPEPARAE